MVVDQPANTLRNSERIHISTPFNLTRRIIYFFRCGANKPVAFDSIYAQNRGGILLSLYDTPNWNIPDECIVIGGGLSKYHAFAQIREFLNFSYVFLLDADIDLPNFSEQTFLRKIEPKSFNCLQFSLCGDSHTAYAFLMKRGISDFRRVNFIEVMAPVFSREGIDRVVHTFPMSISTWGLDFAWAKILGGNGMYVMDTESMTHLGKPDLVDGPFYRYLTSLGIDPLVEMRRLMANFDTRNILFGEVPPFVNGYFYAKLNWFFRNKVLGRDTGNRVW